MKPTLESLLAGATGIYFHGVVEVNGARALSLAIRDLQGKVHDVIVPCSDGLLETATSFMQALEIEVVSVFNKERPTIH